MGREFTRLNLVNVAPPASGDTAGFVVHGIVHCPLLDAASFGEINVLDPSSPLLPAQESKAYGRFFFVVTAYSFHSQMVGSKGALRCERVAQFHPKHGTKTRGIHRKGIMLDATGILVK